MTMETEAPSGTTVAHWLLSPTGVWTLNLILLLTGIVDFSLPQFCEAIASVIFCLSPLFFVYSIALSVYYGRKRKRVHLVVSLVTLLLQALASYVTIMWQIYGLQIQT